VSDLSSYCVAIKRRERSVVDRVSVGGSLESVVNLCGRFGDEREAEFA
jgi:hypothetical protein